jgi:hypothetical protein
MSFTKDFEVELVTKIWDNTGGTRFEICPDADGLGCVEIRFVNEDGKICDRMTFPPEIAQAMADAILLCAKQLKEVEEK